MKRRVIAQPDLRDAVAQLDPLRSDTAPRVDVDRETIRAILATPVDSEAWQSDLDAAEAPLDDL